MFKVTIPKKGRRRARTCYVRFQHETDQLPFGTSAFLYGGVGENLPAKECKQIASVRTKVHNNDQFNRATGRKVALLRLIADLPREDRKLFWNAYWERLKAAVPV